MRSLLESGRAALVDADWPRARRDFEAALETGDRAAAREGLGYARWWLGDVSGAVEAWEASYTEHAETGDRHGAARLALALAREIGALGNVSAARGWESVAERILSALPPCAERIQGILRAARRESDPLRAAELLTEALSTARAIGDRTYEIVVLAAYGRALVCAGRTEEGFVHLDEAMAETTCGNVKDHFLAGDISCNMLVACERAHDLQRATEWSRATEDWARRRGCRPVFAFCRAIYGGVLFARGRWAEAEDEIVDAMRRYEESFPSSPMMAGVVGRLAELRVAQGQLDGARELLDPIYDHPSCTYAAAALDRARGELDVAASRLERRIAVVDSDPSLLAPLCEALAEVHLSRGDHAGARAASTRLASIAASHRSKMLGAMADASLGAIDADEHPTEACLRLSRALDTYVELAVPYRAARTQLALARSLSGARRDAAVAAARSAHDTFQQLGAVPCAEDAAELLRSLSAVRPTTRRRTGVEVLTKREAQVLDLLGEGLSNPSIADRLDISPKTAEHHVCSILAKLDLKTRAAAAAWVVRHAKNIVT